MSITQSVHRGLHLYPDKAATAFVEAIPLTPAGKMAIRQKCTE